MYDSRFEMVRAVDTWSQHDVVVDPDEHLLLESEMNRILPLYRQVMPCASTTSSISAAPSSSTCSEPTRSCCLGGLLFENPYYLSPDEVMAETVARPARSPGYCRR